MKMRKGKPGSKEGWKLLKHLSAVLLTAVLIFNLCACGSSNSADDRDKAAEVTTGQAASDTESGQAVGVTDDPVGSPWADSMLSGNLPARIPEVQDDIYTHYNYDTLTEHQGENYAAIMGNDSAIIDYVGDFLDGKKTDDASAGTGDDSVRDYSDEEIEALRIFYDQAGDLETLAKTGISELQPYLDQVEAAGTLKELNEVLASEDFPFDPYFYTCVSAYDMAGNNNVFIYPNFLFVDNMDGASSYQEPKDDIEKMSFDMSLSDPLKYVAKDLTWLGLSDEEADAEAQKLLDFEKSYGKDAGFTSYYQELDYGAYGNSTSNYSLDELADLCPNYPVRECLHKTGRDKSEFYSVFGAKWVKSFNNVWKEENLDLLKTLTKAHILHECEHYLDPAVYDPLRESNGKSAFDSRTNALTACDQPNTFSQLLCNIYVSDQYTKEDIARLTQMSEDFIASFHQLLDQTSWLSDESKEQCHLKLDKMRLNILAPDGGYLRYDKLKLTSTADGGSLIGNYLKVKKYQEEQINERIGKPALSRLSWEYFPPTMVNCFNDPDTNSINIFPGYTAAAEYKGDESDEQLYGSYGWVIGHEISHGFDFSGSQLDAFGRGKTILSEKDIDKFLGKVDRLVAYYNTIEPLSGVYVNGNKVKTEAAADLVGLQLSLKAAEEKKGFDYEEFFKTGAGMWCMTVTSEEDIQFYLGIDPHPLMYLRTNVNVQMMDEFYDTYDVKKGDGMYLDKEDKIRFWGEEE